MGRIQKRFGSERLWFLAAATVFVAASCGREPAVVLALESETERERALTRHEFVEPHMGSRFRIVVYAGDREEAEAAAGKAFDRIEALDSIMSDYDAESELMRFCRAGAREPVKLSEDLYTVLDRAQKLSRDSEGAFDVTVGNYTRHWRRAMRRGELPDSVVLAELALSSGYEKLTLDPDSRSGQLSVEGMRLDLGGIGKGYAADAALAVLKAEGLGSALAAASGDIAVGAPPPGRDAWRVGIASIDAEDGAADRILLLSEAAVSTSGDNWQFVEIEGRRYSHIVDPRTGIGLGDRIGATVVGPNAVTTDSYATAVSVLGAEKGLEMVARSPGLEAAIVEAGEEGFQRRESPGFSALQAREEQFEPDFGVREEAPPRADSASGAAEPE